MHNISLKTIFWINSFHNKNTSSTGMDTLHKRNIIGFFCVVESLENVCYHESLDFSIEKHHMITKMSKSIWRVGNRCLNNKKRLQFVDFS